MNNVLRLLRIANDLSIAQLSDLLGVTSSFISQIESGKKRPSEDLLIKYSKALKVKPELIKFFDKEEQSNDYRYQDLLLLILEKICNKKNKKL